MREFNCKMVHSTLNVQVEQQAWHMGPLLHQSPLMEKENLRKIEKKREEEMIYVKSVAGRGNEKDGKLCR